MVNLVSDIDGTPPAEDERRTRNLEGLRRARRVLYDDASAQSLRGLGQAIQCTTLKDISEQSPEELWELATAGIEYLDASVQLSMDDIDVGLLRDVARQATRVIRTIDLEAPRINRVPFEGMSTRESRVVLSAYRLSAYVSLTIDHLTGLILAPEPRRRAETAAWSLIREVLDLAPTRRSVDSQAGLFVIRTAADVLDTCSSEYGPLILRRVVRTRDQIWPRLREASFVAAGVDVLEQRISEPAGDAGTGSVNQLGRARSLG